MLQWAARRSIGARIFGAFVVMSFITAALGVYSLYVLTAAGRIVAETYDRPLMAINYARAAAQTFTQMEEMLLRRSTATAEDRSHIDQSLESLTANFFGDLDIARERSMAADDRALTEQIKDLVKQWNQRRRAELQATNTSDLNALSEEIADRFDMLVELTTDHGFVERRKAISEISRFEYTNAGALVLALICSAALTLLLARRIVRPLTAAAAVADRIAGGELQAPIPAGGEDETGTLLRSMTVMQDSIRAMIEREVAERRSAQRRFSDALEGVHEGMMLVDADGKIVRANSQIAEFFPIVAPHLVEGANFAAVFSEVEREIAWATNTRTENAVALPDQAKPVPLSSGGEFRLTDGRWIHVSRSVAQDGGFFLFVSNFTEIKQREEAVIEAKKRAEAAYDAKTKFLANMSHELRTPLHSIIGFSEIISQETLGKFENPQYAEFASEILKSGQHLLEIINDVLDLAKSEDRDYVLSADEVDLPEILRMCAKIMEKQCASAELEFTIAIPESRLCVRGEPQKLRQIFLNLLSNAIKFTQRGGKITFSAIALTDSLIRVDVADTGIGMRPEDVPLALSPFGQIDTKLDRAHQGTGLGLALSKKLIELHGGIIHIDTELGKGTTVSVILPVQTEARPQAVAKAS